MWRCRKGCPRHTLTTHCSYLWLLVLLAAVACPQFKMLHATKPSVDYNNNNNNSSGCVEQRANVAINATVNDNNFEQIVLRKLQEEQEEKEEEEAEELPTSKHEILSRKRRYLIFPEGSSLQAVYCGIVCIVDYNQYLVMGITVALAWELPSKPPSDVFNSIRERLKDDDEIFTRHPKRNDTISNITYVDTNRKYKTKYKTNYINLDEAQPSYNHYYTNRKIQPVFQTPMHPQYYYRPTDNYYRPAQRKYINYADAKGAWLGQQQQPLRNFYSVNRQPFWKWTDKPVYVHGLSGPTSTSTGKYPWWKLPSRLSNAFHYKSPSGLGLPFPQVPARRLDNYIESDNQQQYRQQYRPQPPPPSPSQQPELQKKKQQKQKSKTKTGYYQSKKVKARKHRIFPIYGKRSIRATFVQSNNNNKNNSKSNMHSSHRVKRHGITRSELSKMDRIHIRYQRSSRHSLYKKVEKYLDRGGFQGHHCVLRALCETGQKYGERKPTTLMGEVMRAVFTMPEALEEDLAKRSLPHTEVLYDEAHAFEGDCAERYQECTKSLWTSMIVQ